MRMSPAASGWFATSCRLAAVSALMPGLVVLAGCTSSSGSNEDGRGGKSSVANVEFPEGDPSVSAELGGPGFTGEGWETASPSSWGDSRAIKGGAIQAAIYDWPENLHRYGTGSNTWLNYLIGDLSYESLCGNDPRTLETIPRLATHWKVSEDNMVFHFRINPKAHWSDGKPVVVDDWIATYRLINDDTLIAPMTKDAICGMMEEPKALSKYMMEVRVKEKSWRNFLQFSGLTPLPAHEIAGMSGEDYRKKYQFELPATSGPYAVHDKGIDKGRSITLTRRTDWWAKDDPTYEGLYNFDLIRLNVEREPRLAFDKACRGDLDVLQVSTAEWWTKDITPLAAYKLAHLIRVDIFTKYPRGIQGQVFNMRKAPLDDVRVRQALAHLYDRRTMLSKFAYDQYELMSSYYPGSDFSSPNNEPVEYDPEKALELLADAGWTERGADGVLMKGGKRLSVTLTYSSQAFERYLTVYQEACRKVGVEFKLQNLLPETRWKTMQEQTFEMTGVKWGATLFPFPKSNWHSTMADEKGSNNVGGLKSDKVDKLIAQYDAEFDPEKRKELLRELDGALFNEHPYVLEWYLAPERFIYWNKFGRPDFGLNRYDEFDDVFSLWWYDPAKAKKLKEARQAGEPMGVIPPLELRPWDEPSVTTAQGPTPAPRTR